MHTAELRLDRGKMVGEIYRFTTLANVHKLTTESAQVHGP
jgi:hypothetical protein